MGKRRAGIVLLFIIILVAVGWYAIQPERAIAALDTETGRLQWQHAEARPLDDFAFDEQRVVTWVSEPDRTRTLAAWDRATGTRLWTFDPSRLISPYGVAASTQLARLPVLSDNHVYFVITVDEDPDDLELVVAVDAARGEFLWMKELNIFAGSHTRLYPLAAAGDRVFLFEETGEGALALVALHGSDGEPLWSVPNAANTRDGSSMRVFGGQTLPLASNGDWLVVTTLSTVTAYDASNGEEQWQNPLATPAHPYNEISDGGFYLQTDTELASLYIYTGEEQWRVPAGGSADANELAPRNDAVAVLERGALLEPTTVLAVVESGSGAERWRTTYTDSVVEGFGNQVAASPTTILLYDPTAAAFVGYSTTDGAVRWKKNVSAAPYLLADYGDYFYVNAELPRWQWWVMGI